MVEWRYIKTEYCSDIISIGICPVCLERGRGRGRERERERERERKGREREREREEGGGGRLQGLSGITYFTKISEVMTTNKPLCCLL